MSKYNKTLALILCIFLGYFGVHNFYVKKNKMGLLYLCTIGLFGIGWIVDIVMICTDKFKDGDGLIVASPKSNNMPNANIYNTPAVNSINKTNSSQNIKPSSGVSNNQPSIDIPKEIDGQPLKYKYFDVKICVIDGQEPDYNNIIERLKVVPVVTTLELEPDNEYDNQAVKVMDGQNKLGYLYKGKIKDIAYDYLTKNRPIFSCLSNMDLDTYEMKMFIGLYYLKPYSGSTTFKLTSNTNSEMQDELMCCSVGDELTFHYDYDKEKYCFTNFGDIGYAPKSKNELLEQIEYDCRATVNEVDINDNGKYSVVVKIEYDE